MQRRRGHSAREARGRWRLTSPFLHVVFGPPHHGSRWGRRRRCPGALALSSAAEGPAYALPRAVQGTRLGTPLGCTGVPALALFSCPGTCLGTPLGFDRGAAFDQTERSLSLGGMKRRGFPLPWPMAGPTFVASGLSPVSPSVVADVGARTVMKSEGSMGPRDPTGYCRESARPFLSEYEYEVYD